jgi:hypothetical protein
MSKAILPFLAAASPYQNAGIVKSRFEDRQLHRTSFLPIQSGHEAGMIALRSASKKQRESEGFRLA